MTDLEELREENDRLRERLASLEDDFDRHLCNRADALQAENRMLRQTIEYLREPILRAKMMGPLPPIIFAPGKWYTSEEWAKEFPPPASPAADFDTGPLIAKARERADEARNDPRGIWGTIGIGSNAIIARQIQDTWERLGAEAFERARVESVESTDSEKPDDRFDPKNWGV